MEEKKFQCSKEGMVEAQAFLETLCPEPKPSIISDEVVSNIVRCSGAADFSIGFERTADGIKMVFVDDGRPFDPTQDIPTPDVTAALEDRGVGGLGIFMVKKMSKAVAYRRENEKNVLTVVL